MLVDGFCDAETTNKTDRGIFEWDETVTNSTRTVPCPFGPPDAIAIRTCISRLNWTMPSVNSCATIVTERFLTFNETLVEVCDDHSFVLFVCFIYLLFIPTDQ